MVNQEVDKGVTDRHLYRFLLADLIEIHYSSLQKPETRRNRTYAINESNAHGN